VVAAENPADLATLIIVDGWRLKYWTYMLYKPHDELHGLDCVASIWLDTNNEK